MKSSKAVIRKHKSIRRRIERVGVDPQSLISQTTDYDIKGVLSFNEIPHNSQTGYMLNKNSIKVGQHLNCVVLEDLLKIEQESSICLSLSNHRICGRAQFPSALLEQPELADYTLNDDEFIVLGYANGVISERLTHRTEGELISGLGRESSKPDYNLEELLNDNRDCPGLYKNFMASQGIKENQTLLAFSNTSFFKDNELSYSKLKNIQNTKWAKQHYQTGLDMAKQNEYEQAITYYTHAIEYDRELEDAYIAKAYALLILNKLKNAKVEIYKLLEFNQNNRKALDLLGTINERLRSGPEMMYGKVEISLKKKNSAYNSQHLLLD